MPGLRDFAVTRARYRVGERAGERRWRGLVERAAQDQGSIFDFFQMGSQVKLCKSQARASEALGIDGGERRLALGDDLRMALGKLRWEHATDGGVEDGLHAARPHALGHGVKRRARRLG